MKTYTIKPLEWVEFKHHPLYAIFAIAGRSSITIQESRHGRYDLHFEDIAGILCDIREKFDTLEAAKAKAQELHEAELMKYLQEVTA